MLLNFLLFLPVYLFFRGESSFWPLAGLSGAAPAELLLALFWQRDNHDVFRLNVEWTLVVALWMFVKPLRRRAFLLITLLLYLLQMGYAIYEGFIRSYYLLDPVFFNDAPLFGSGAGFTLQSLNLPAALYLGGLLIAAGCIALLTLLVTIIFGGIAPEGLSRGTRLALLALALAALGATTAAGGKMAGDSTTAVSSFTAKLSQNVTRSRLAQVDNGRFSDPQLLQHYQFTENQLNHKPNIYIIFIESYGSVLYQRSAYIARYHVLLKQLQAQLDENGWQVASTRSNAPTWGGGSWISYTSALSGLRLNSHTQYLAFLNQYQSAPFPHLINYLRSQGYRSYRLSGMADELNEVEWQRYKTFYGIDEWLRFSEVAYDGPLYGWGPALPDQYAIHYANEQISSAADVPAVFFYITQNSHYPWTPLPELSPDWRILNDAPPAQQIQAQSQAELRQHYFASIEYELEMLAAFIIQEGSQDDIFVLIGDHQPARVARYADGWDTPLHIISRDASFITPFYAFEFVPGLNTRKIEPSMNHAGFYSLFMRILLQQYGLDPENVPEYMPEGIPLNEEKP